MPMCARPTRKKRNRKNIFASTTHLSSLLLLVVDYFCKHILRKGMIGRGRVFCQRSCLTDKNILRIRTLTEGLCPQVLSTNNFISCLLPLYSTISLLLCSLSSLLPSPFFFSTVYIRAPIIALSVSYNHIFNDQQISGVWGAKYFAKGEGLLTMQASILPVFDRAIQLILPPGNERW
jgi:hypothetical protein